MKFFLISIAFLVGTGFCMGQTTRDATPTPPKPVYQSYKVEKSKKSGFLFFKKRETENTDDYREQFRDRMKVVAKQRKKDLKMAEDPQYSNPLYFGHKKPPKKRKNGKKKFCKECGLVH